MSQLRQFFRNYYHRHLLLEQLRMELLKLNGINALVKRQLKGFRQHARKTRHQHFPSQTQSRHLKMIADW